MRKLSFFGGVALVAFGAAQWMVHSAERERNDYAVRPDGTGYIRAPVMYGSTMLIAVTDEGVAAVAFKVKDPKFVNVSAEYRFRYLKDADSEEVTGTGRVLDSQSDKDKATIKAGPIRIGWSGSGHDRGYVLYQPEDMQLSIADVSDFEDWVLKAVDQEVRMQKIDLKRFLRKN